MEAYSKATSERQQAQVKQQEKTDLADALAHWSDPEPEVFTSMGQMFTQGAAPVTSISTPITSEQDPKMHRDGPVQKSEDGEGQVDSQTHQTKELEYHTLEAAPTASYPPKEPQSSTTSSFPLQHNLQTPLPTRFDPVERMWGAGRGSTQDFYMLHSCISATECLRRRDQPQDFGDSGHRSKETETAPPDAANE